MNKLVMGGCTVGDNSLSLFACKEQKSDSHLQTTISLMNRDSDEWMGQMMNDKDEWIR